MTILQELDRYYGRMAARDEVVLPGWSMEPIGVVLELDRDGVLLGTELRLDDRKRPQVHRAPKWFSRQGKASTPYFLWDNAAYALGLGAKDPGKTARDHAAFKALHAGALADSEDDGLRALRGFLEGWAPDRERVPSLDDKMLAFNIAFRLRGEDGLLHERAAAMPIIDRLRASGREAATGFCLVRGQNLPLVRLHPKIKGVDGTAAAEVPLVSFNNDAFASYGKEQGYNAPTSDDAAFRYGAALNALLARGGRQRLRIADATVTFWADASALDAASAEAAARQADNLFGAIFGDAPAPEPVTDAGEGKRVQEALQTVAAGAALSMLAPGLVEGVRFNVLALAPNAARLSIRTWLSDDFRRFVEALAAWQRDLDIDPAPWRDTFPSVHRVLRHATALQEDAKNIPPGLGGATLRAVLDGTRLPRTLLAAAVIRLRAGDDPGRGWHAAAIKACLARTLSEESPPVSLDPDNPNQAYQLGRLFAVLEKAQRVALGRVNASIADRYYGSFSATPARVFGTLMRGARVHISAAEKQNTFWINARLQGIIDLLGPDLPKVLRLEDQDGEYHHHHVWGCCRERQGCQRDGDRECDGHRRHNCKRVGTIGAAWGVGRQARGRGRRLVQQRGYRPGPAEHSRLRPLGAGQPLRAASTVSVGGGTCG